MINLSSIPDACMAYTSVFQTLRIEMFVCLAIGLVIGIFAEKFK